jgi:hypothetical protein
MGERPVGDMVAILMSRRVSEAGGWPAVRERLRYSVDWNTVIVGNLGCPGLWLIILLLNRVIAVGAARRSVPDVGVLGMQSTGALPVARSVIAPLGISGQRVLRERDVARSRWVDS